ncbi:MAG: hypothetical protein ACRDRJ_41350 [Streptosporangiaceae bacterium]
MTGHANRPGRLFTLACARAEGLRLLAGADGSSQRAAAWLLPY